MMIRQLVETDLPKLIDIHRRYYEKEFPFPELCDPTWLGKYVVTDEFDNPVLFGGVRLLAEAVAMTDKGRPVKERRAALVKLLQASLWTCNNWKQDLLHAFIINDPAWERQLKSHGFRNCKGTPLVIDVKE